LLKFYRYSTAFILISGGRFAKLTGEVMSMDKRFVIGNFIYELRREKGWTQKELGDLLGVTNKAVSKWETGAALPRVEYLRDLASVLGCTQEELFLGRRIPKDEAEPAEAPEESYISVVQRCDACQHEGKFSKTGPKKGKFVCKKCGAEIKPIISWSIVLLCVIHFILMYCLLSLEISAMYKLGIMSLSKSYFPNAEERIFYRQLNEHFPHLNLIGSLATIPLTLLLCIILFSIDLLLFKLFDKKHWIKYRIVRYPHSEDGKIVF
ncbi:MAG: helix-turn-helix transcriptional regulator, partial [Clostridia bacterium]|nr:helix-turn-helix transcriptional regulator [Clostridia bacterium]